MVLVTQTFETFANGVDGEFDKLLTSSDFFGVEKFTESCATAGCDDGEMMGFALIEAVAATFVCFLRGTADLLVSGLETISFGGDLSLLNVVSSGGLFVVAWSRAFFLSFTSSSKRTDIADDGVDTVDTDELLIGDGVNNCFEFSVFCAETVGDGVVALLTSAVCALLMLLALTGRPTVADLGVCCNAPDFDGLTGTVFGVCNGSCCTGVCDAFNCDSGKFKFECKKKFNNSGKLL